MRLRGILSCAFCASVFSFSAWGYTTTSTSSIMWYDIFPSDGGWPTSSPFIRCANNGNLDSVCNTLDFAYIGEVGGRIEAAVSPAGNTFSMWASLGAYGFESYIDMEADVDMVDLFKFTPNPGQNQPVEAQVTVWTRGRLDPFIVAWAGTFNGQNMPQVPDTLLTQTLPYDGTPIEVNIHAQLFASASQGEDGQGDIDVWLNPIVMLDAEGNVVTGKMEIVPEPGYWPVVAALVLGFAAIGRLKPGRFQR